MGESHYWKVLRNIFTKAATKKSQNADESLPSIYVSEITFRDGTRLQLKKDSIVVITGANNSGKSSVLRNIVRTMRDDRKKSDPVVADISMHSEGTAESFRTFIESRCLKGSRKDEVFIGYHTYNLSEIPEDCRRAFRGKEVSALFYSILNAAARLESVEAAEREQWTQRSPTGSLQWLDFEVDAETEISELFQRAFGLSLIVNRAAGRKLILQVCKDALPEFDNYKDYQAWLSGLPTLQEQGDGMKSFAAVLLGIKIHPKSLILLDEPEAFLHDPHARRLAEVITKETSGSSQIWVATHSDEIVQGLLDSSDDRIVVVRLDRASDTTSANVLSAQQVKALWTDPLLRTSDILSALFHEVAVICEGETDVRFFRSLIDAIPSGARLPDFKLYHVGGKDKIAGIVTALRALKLPVCVTCDLDILSDKEKFLTLFSALGGDPQSVASEILQIVQHVTQRNTLITGQEAARRLRDIASDVESESKLSTSHRQRIGGIIKESSAWGRLKADGYRGFDNATIVQAFERLYEKSKAVGLLINREGELEGLCREAPRTNKSVWLEDVLKRDLKSDPGLEDGRKMLGELRSCIAGIRDAV